tara:strand:+ start:99 stop:677 length:579 start_codon:yes stop_codon:yes gene_type:complete
MNNKEKIKVIHDAIKVLKKGGVILYPTDTIWGIGCDATNEVAIKKIYSIKKRSTKKPFILLMNNDTMLANYIQIVPEIAKDIIKKETNPITIIYNQPMNLPKCLHYQNTIGIRIVKEKSIQQFITNFNKPITSTSANISNEKNPINFEEISDEVKHKVDYIFPVNFIENPTIPRPSKIIKIYQNSTIKIIRS